MKVIFLDIDGVLNCSSTPNPRKFPYIIDETLVARFRALVEHTGATVVMSSTWRVDPVGLLAAKFYGIPFDDVCPDVPTATRSEELKLWLSDHSDTSRYAVIDDENDGLDSSPLFQPSASHGLTSEIADGVALYLSGATDADMRRPAMVRFGQNIHALFKRDKN